MIINYRGYAINIRQDPNPDNPREWDSMGKMYCFHPKYQLGDKHNFHQSDFRSWKHFLQHIKPRIYAPIYLLDHSGIDFSYHPYNDHYDSGQIGYIVDNHPDCTIDILQSEIITYNHFLNNRVYGYEILSIGDSCWGYYGDDHENSGLLESAKNAIDSHISIITRNQGIQLCLNL